jgi:hypothetical protein
MEVKRVRCGRELMSAAYFQCTPLEPVQWEKRRLKKQAYL